jgi:hypothetical protein
MAKEKLDAITSAADEAAMSDIGTAKAKAVAEKATKESAKKAEDRKKAEGAGQKLPEIKAVFIRDSFKHETADSDTTYKEGEEVEFASYAEYYRWHRRGACETAEDRQVRVAQEVAKKAQELRNQKTGG